jgi:DNA-binding FadR family transcriptional regulator
MEDGQIDADASSVPDTPNRDTKRTSSPGARPTNQSEHLSELIAKRIQDDIFSSGLAVGDVVGSETFLIEKYGVSRAVFREAARVVQHNNVARMRRGRGGGLIVAAPDGAAVEASVALYLRFTGVDRDQILATRTALEISCVGEVTEKITESGVAILNDVLEEERRAGLDAFADGDINYRLHVAIAKLSNNPALALFVEVLAHIEADAARSRKQEWNVPLSVAANQYHYAHEKIVDAIISGDSALAQHRMRRHLRGIAEFE